MKKQRWEESERRRAEETRSEQKKGVKKDDAGARTRKKSHETLCFFQGELDQCRKFRQERSNMGIAIVNHPPFITFFTGGMFTRMGGL